MVSPSSRRLLAAAGRRARVEAGGYPEATVIIQEEGDNKTVDQGLGQEGSEKKLDSKYVLEDTRGFADRFNWGSGWG